jgi:predicted TIM-barrel enzyme
MWPMRGSSNRARGRSSVTAAISADRIRVFADVKRKHSALALTADVSDVKAVARAVAAPTLVGSGITLANLREYSDADAAIVGLSVKHGGIQSGVIDASRAGALARAFDKT